MSPIKTMNIHVPEGMEDRHILQLFMDSTGKTALFREDGSDEAPVLGLDIVGWASWLRLEAGEQPSLVVSPVVEDEDYGPIMVEDFLYEQPGLVYAGFES